MFQVVDNENRVRVSGVTEETADAIVAAYDGTLPELGYSKRAEPARTPSAFGRAVVRAVLKR